MQDENRDDSKNESQEGKLGATEPHPERRTLNRTQLTFVSIAVLLCLALIGGSAWSLVSGGGLPVGAEAQGEGSSVQTSDSSTASKEPELDEADASEDASDAVDQPVAGDDASGGASSGLKSDASNKDKTGSNAGGDGSGFSSAGSGASGSSDAQDSTSSEPRTVTVTISADGTVGGGSVVGPVTLTFDEGATVYDALANTGWSPLAEWGAFGAYVTSINGVAAASDTGWTYTVNGSQPNYACSAYTLSDGDVIQWTFVKVK